MLLRCHLSTRIPSESQWLTVRQKEARNLSQGSAKSNYLWKLFVQCCGSSSCCSALQSLASESRLQNASKAVVKKTRKVKIYIVTWYFVVCFEYCWEVKVNGNIGILSRSQYGDFLPHGNVIALSSDATKRKQINKQTNASWFVLKKNAPLTLDPWTQHLRWLIPVEKLDRVFFKGLRTSRKPLN